jgi:hypothetical protein
MFHFTQSFNGDHNFAHVKFVVIKVVCVYIAAGLTLLCFHILVVFEGKGGVCDTLSGLIRCRLENEANFTKMYHKLKY